MTFSVAVAGASGYAGGEVLRLLAGHPEFDVRTITAHSNAGQRLVDVQPHLRSFGNIVLQETTAENLTDHDVVFLALPHGASAALAAQFSHETLVVDCGADHRLDDPNDWKAFYGGDHTPSWAYGIPELPLANEGTQRDNLRGIKRIAAPGCNASAVSLALAPGIRANLIESTDLVSVLAVGPSGAGKSLKAELLASEIMGSASAYAVGGIHRHTPEILQNLRKAGAHEVSISMTPVLVPMARGILATSTARIKPGVTLDQLHSAWCAAYENEPFVKVLPLGQFPRTADTLGANTCLIGLALDTTVGRVVVVSALDNLVKGTAGAAIQSANIALGLPEATGLPVNGVAP
ncbi:N-acetyl-gamma-glutamyl-phosphate reductase [Alpinimonas psychrophila]|uniref:N-acetyl-gamma-glutamyl-phosphate reductase n=1 Tax=Alpinimonas psychrophila TaxID=748908 RepID=A0A7W3PNJ0_9MICO|nr:N-acetyl-gamma-glutamyl-phosphate reductase [Alpinimonas psychrophila]MBA8828258.1 N-acetyl-gamma-glutamyl-phosphate reductase [Alpinimonas psychrophila]